MMIRYRALALLAGAAALTACGKKEVQDITGAVPGASVKFFNFGVNAPGVNFYANDQKVTAISSTTGAESTNGTTFGGVGNGGFYSGLTPGAYTLSGRIAATTDKDLAIANIPATLEDGKFYSAYLSGFYNTTTKAVDGFIVEDTFIPQQDFSVAYVRFVNAISNSSPMTLYAKNQTTNVETAIGGDVAYKTAGGFVAVPNAVYNLGTRPSGSTTNVITRNDVSFVGGRVYTIGARGDITVVSTTATNRPFLDNTTNR